MTQFNELTAPVISMCKPGKKWEAFRRWVFGQYHGRFSSIYLHLGSNGLA